MYVQMRKVFHPFSPTLITHPNKSDVTKTSHVLFWSDAPPLPV